MKKRSDAQCRRDFVALAFASLFRVAGEVFAALPAIERVLVSGYIQRIDQATGHPYDEYVISAIIDRAQWQRIDFERLHAVDPAATFATSMPVSASTAPRVSSRSSPTTSKIWVSCTKPGGAPLQPTETIVMPASPARA